MSIKHTYMQFMDNFEFAEDLKGGRLTRGERELVRLLNKLAGKDQAVAMIVELFCDAKSRRRERVAA